MTIKEPPTTNIKNFLPSMSCLMNMLGKKNKKRNEQRRAKKTETSEQKRGQMTADQTSKQIGQSSQEHDQQKRISERKRELQTRHTQRWEDNESSSGYPYTSGYGYPDV
ncbi:hypothetical protein ACH5RR_029789 [Cinchona calisaya]|uniref:Uncharacterized protein n=1 Tax=Cinchona calisaya TaxID=153742 RepID=A0ABD2YST2_9GENT